jgi:hypothetical protein
MTQYKWLPVIDLKLQSFLNNVSIKPGWYPNQNGHATVAFRAKALRTPEPTYRIAKYPFRTSIAWRGGTWWILDLNVDLRKQNRPSFLGEEVQVLVSFFMPEEKVYPINVHKPQLSHEVLGELMEHFLDPVSGSHSKGRKVLAIVCVHC